jgi:putrescine importer
VNRHLGLGALVLFGLAYLAPLIVLGTFGVVAQASMGATPSSYLLALLAMLFTAASYGRMAARHPVAGSAYSYVCHAIDRRLGFMVGWAVTLDYLFLPMVIWLIGAAYLHDSFPMVPMPALVLGFIVVTTGLNVLGFRLAKGINGALMAVQAVVIVVFLALALVYVGHRPDLAPLAPFGIGGTGRETGIVPIAAGAAIAAYSFLGFDAVTTLAEECHDPRRLLPRAIWLTALIGGLIFVIVAYVTQLAHPGHAFRDPAAAANEIALAIGGRWFQALFLAGLVVAQFASGIAAQAAGARLIHAMARDGVLPRRLLGQLHPRFGTPVAAVVLTGVIGLVALGLTVESSTSFINFGAFTAFAAVNLAVIATARREGRQGVLGWYLAPAIGMVIDLWLLTRLEPQAIELGLVWLILGLAVLLRLTGGFRRAPPALHVEAH